MVRTSILADSRFKRYGVRIPALFGSRNVAVLGISGRGGPREQSFLDCPEAFLDIAHRAASCCKEGGYPLSQRLIQLGVRLNF